MAAAGDVGAALTATDGEGDTLTYTLGGADVAKFTVNSSSGQLRTKAGERYDREAKASYSVTVKASDPSGGSDTVAVTINVANVVEKPLTPAAPTVTVTSGSTTSLEVSWAAWGERGAPRAIGLQAALPDRERRLDGPPAHGSDDERDHRQPAGNHGLRGAGAGGERRRRR